MSITQQPKPKTPLGDPALWAYASDRIDEMLLRLGRDQSGVPDYLSLVNRAAQAIATAAEDELHAIERELRP